MTAKITNLSLSLLTRFTTRAVHSSIAFRVKHSNAKKGKYLDSLDGKRHIFHINLLISSKNTRPNWRKERETNQETFGHSAVRSLAYRRAGGRGGYYRRGMGRPVGGGGY
jgi:hypothetical protein